MQTNPGETFNTGFEAGATRGAMGVLGQNPNDPRALGVLAQFNPQAAMQMRTFGRAEEARNRNVQAGALAAAGDTAGARALMLRGGDIEGATNISQMEGQAAKARRERLEAYGGVLTAIQALPYEQRRPAIQARAAELQSTFGFTPQQIAEFDPTDQNIGLMAAEARTAAEQLNYSIAGRQEIDGAVLDRNGNILFESPYPRIIPGSEGSFFQQPRVTGGGRAAPATAAPAAAAAPAPMSEADLRAAADRAIAAGAPRDAVEQRLQEQLQARGGPGQANAPATFPEVQPGTQYPPGQWR